MKQRFEHIKVSIEEVGMNDPINKVLKLYEKKGWELVSVTEVMFDAARYEVWFTLFFKRPYEN